MNTLALKKETETFGLKKILLTLKKGPGYCHMTAWPIGKNRGVKNTDRKLNTITSKNDGHDDVFSKEMHNIKKIDTNDRLRPKITQLPMKNRKHIRNTKKILILDNALISESEFCEKFNKNLCKPQTTYHSNKKAPLEPPTLNKHDRFVPNILRSTKMAENTFNNNSLIRFDRTHIAHSHETDKHCKDDKNVKRKRKQVLSSLNIKRDWTQRAQVLSDKDELNKALLRNGNHHLIGESVTRETLRKTATDKKKKDSNTCLEIKPESSSATAEELTMDFCDPEDSYSANSDISDHTKNLPGAKEADINCNYDKSIEKILAEFETADYQNYIDREDLGFAIDEMDKLLSSDIEGSLTDSLIFNHNTEIVEYDMNGNDIDNHGNALKKSINKKKLKRRNIQCNIESCYEDRTEPKINTSRRLRCDMNSDYICSSTWDDRKSCKSSKMNLWSNELEDYYSIDDFRGFHLSVDRDLSSTDTAFESETNELDSIQTSCFLLQKNENLERFATSLVVSDMVPENVFSDESNELCSDGLESDDGTVRPSLPSSPTLRQYCPNSNDSNDNNYCTSSSGIPRERLASNLQSCDGFDANLEFFEHGHFLVDDMVNINCTISKEDETCENILADSNTKFDNQHLSSIRRDLSDFDIENIDDIKISQLLMESNTRINKFPSVSDATLQPYAINAPDNELSIDNADQSNSNNNSMSKDDDSKSNIMKFEDPPQVKAESILKEATHWEGVESSFGVKIETGLQGCNAGDEDFEHSNSATANIPTRSDGLLSLYDAKAKDINSTVSSSRCLPISLIERRNMTELETSEFESQLTQTQTCADYLDNHYPSAMSRNVITDPKITNAEHFSQVIGHSDNDISYSPTSSYKSCHSQVTGYENIGEISSSCVDKKINAITEDTVITVSDNYDVAKLGKNADVYNCQSIPYSLSVKKPALSGKLPINLKKQTEGLWKDLVKRSKCVNNNVSYIPCDFCENKYRSQAALADHIKLIHRYQPSRFRYRNKKYICDKCAKEYTFAAAIEKHFKLHDDYILTCRICEKHFSERVFLRRHVHAFHLHWKFDCTHCTRKFSRSNARTQHIRKCHGVEDFP